jgi:hypothetical protein
VARGTLHYCGKGVGSSELGTAGRAAIHWDLDIAALGKRCEAFFIGKPQRRTIPVRTSTSGASATQWRQMVATDASPWIVRKQRFSVPKGRQEILEQSLCRPFGTHRQCCSTSTGSHPWLKHAVPLGLNRKRLPASVFHIPTIDRSKMLHSGS